MIKGILRGTKRIFSRVLKVINITGIRSIITLSFTAVTILSMIFVSIALYHLFYDSAEKNAASSTQQIMDQVNLNLNSYFKGMMDISDIIRNNLSSSHNEEKTLTEIMKYTSMTRNDIVTMAIYSGDGDLLTCFPQGKYNENFIVKEQYWFKNAITNPVDFSFLPPHVQRIFEDERPWVVSLCRGVTYYEKGKPINLVTVVDMNFSTIERLCKQVSLGKRGYIYIVDKSGNIIYHPQQQIIYAGLKSENIKDALSREQGSYLEKFQGERRIMTIKNISYTGWKMVGISYIDELVANKNYFTTVIISIALFGIVFEILASIFISAKVSQPIKRLERQMKKVENGDFDITLEDIKGEDEVKRLSRAFNIMVTKIKQLMAQIIREQEEKRKSELKALQAQINPHFLYNTLDSIVWMNENRNYEGVTIMVSALAKLFRVSISKGKEIISIADEIEHARSYLIIQKIRYKEKFDFTIEVDQQLLSKRTLKLILQPIIENAIYHGINPLHEKGKINITVSRDGNDVLFKVSDNGYGIKPEIINQLLDQESTSYHSGGVGLKNVHERIRLCYGKNYGIAVESEIDVGTTVIIRIPLSEGNEGGKYETSA